MDAPKCRLCGNRHYGLCTVFSKPDVETFVRKGTRPPPVPPVVVEDPVEGEPDDLPELPEGVVCPVCERRRLKEQARMIKHRAGKRGIL